jgi:hypothetical protein
VCQVCCGPNGGSGVCFACRWVSERLGLPLAPVFAVRVCPLPGPLYTVLMGYKEAPVAEIRARFRPMVRALVDAFVSDHGPCLGGDVALAVPSTARPGGSPLAGIEGLGESVSRHLGAHWCDHLLERAMAPLGHMEPDRRGFVVPAPARPRLRGARVVLLDDTYVSGARAQSAAAALRLAGAASVAVVVLGRVVRPNRLAAHAVFLRDVAASGARRRGAVQCRACAQTVACTE